MDKNYFSNILKVNNIYLIIAFTIPLPMLFNNISILLLIIGILISVFFKKDFTIKLAPFFLISSIFFLYLFSYFLSDDKTVWSKNLEKNLVFFIFPFFMLLHNEKINIKKILYAFSIGTSILSFISIANILYYYFSSNLWSITHQNLSNKVGLNAIYFSIFINLVNIFLISEVILLNHRKKQILLLFVVLVNSIVLVFLSSRVVLLTHILSVFGVLVYSATKGLLSFKKMTLLLVSFLLTFTIAISSNSVLRWRVKSLFYKEFSVSNMPQNTESGIKLRTQLWSSAIDIIKKNPILGVGSGDYKQEVLNTYKEKKFRKPYRWILITHNQYLTYAASFGLIGLAIFLFQLLVYFKIFLRSKQLIAFLFVFSVATISITESFLYVNKGIVFYVFFSSIFVINSFYEKKI